MKYFFIEVKRITGKGGSICKVQGLNTKYVMGFEVTTWEVYGGGGEVGECNM